MESSLAHLKIESFKQILTKLSENAAIKLIMSLAGTSWVFIFGDNVHFVYVILLLILIDTSTGVWKAAKARIVSSKGFFKFTAKVLVYLMLLATAALIDKSLPVHFSLTLMGSFLAITEAISILENIAILGFPVPTKLVKVLKDYNAMQPAPNLKRKKKSRK